MRRNKGRSDANSNRCAEVEGKECLVQLLTGGAVPWMDGVESKLMVSIGVASDEFHFVDAGRSLAETFRLQHADKNHRAVRQHAVERDVLTGEIVPSEIRFLDEEGLIFIPAGDFDAITLGKRQGVRNAHSHDSPCFGEHLGHQLMVVKGL